MTKVDLYTGLQITLGRPPFPPMVDFIVEFVATWIEDADPTMTENWMAETWREEMS